MLIFFKENSAKANIIYDLRECMIKGNYVQDSLNNYNKIKRNSRTYFKLSNMSLANEKLFNDKKRKSSRSSNNPTSSNTDEDNDTITNKMHLNYLVEVDHPYQQKCVIKSDCVFEALEFYKNLTKINK